MIFPYDKQSAPNSKRYVPLPVAQELVAHRDRLQAEVQKLQREKSQLQEELNAAKAESKVFERRVVEAERAAADVIQKLESYAESPRKEEKDRGDAEMIAGLTRRIEVLSADLSRLRERTTTEISQARGGERRRLLAGLGEVFDSIERGLDVDVEGPWRQGLEAIRNQFLVYLHAEGVRLTGEPGEPMDPRIHQAIDSVDDDAFESGQIVRVARKGMELEDGTVIRPALVAVAR